MYAIIGFMFIELAAWLQSLATRLLPVIAAFGLVAAMSAGTPGSIGADSPSSVTSDATSTTSTSSRSATPAVLASDVVGTGWKAVVGCVACVATGIGIVMGGPVAITAALFMPGGAIALAGCIGVCWEAIK